ncbi:hypothetical protein V2A60_000921 [Cordyceps javanica]|uniref:C6 transcription factor n=1 Tax=Cordyceps javanica TaxID=43265 RepID=A0A545V202_9HYPO|nr:C6 transcription factor [Cordyceps javanica]TQW07056.1 C6 transcription factor [Cordyceps javanica]
MPPRRSHKKSRAGCRRCKNRKIKCDEVHPRCGNCVKHGVMCDFENPEVLDELASAATPAAARSPPVPSPTNLQSNNHHNGHAATTNGNGVNGSRPSPRRQSPIPPHIHTPNPPPPVLSPSVSESLHNSASQSVQNGPTTSSSSAPTRPVDRMLELRLWHHYTTSTYKTLLHNVPAANDIWQFEVPKLAFAGKTYLADAILAVSALHLRSLNPDDKNLVQATHAYSASALADYCSSLAGGIHDENAEALFLTACLIAFQATASRIFIKDDGEMTPSTGKNSSRYPLPSAWFHAFQGVKTIVATSWQWIFNSPTVVAVINSQPSFQLDMNPLGSSSFFGHLLEGVEDEISSEDPQVNLLSQQGYVHAVSVLNWAHQNPYPPATLAFPAAVSKRFVQLVEAKRPRALAIVACFFALLKRMDNVWWLGDVSRREVMGLVSLFEPGSGWWRHLEWPVRIALWDGDANAIPAAVWGAECEEEPTGEYGLVETMKNHVELLARMSHAIPQSPTADLADITGELGFTAVPLD